MASGGRRDLRRAAEVRAGRRTRRSERRRDRVLAWARGIRMLDLAVCAGTIAVSVWAWIVFVIAVPQDLQWGQVVITLAAALGLFVLIGRFQVRRRWPNPADLTEGERFPLVLVPVFVVPIVLVVITPPATAVPGFVSGFTVYGVIALVPLLMLLGLLGALLVALLVVWPVLLLVDGIRGQRRVAGDTTVQAQAVVSGVGRMFSNAQLVILAIILLAAVGFAIAMTGVYPEASGSSRQRIAQTFRAWIFFQGQPAPSLVALFFVVIAVAAGLASNRPIWASRPRRGHGNGPVARDNV